MGGSRVTGALVEGARRLLADTSAAEYRIGVLAETPVRFLNLVAKCSDRAVDYVADHEHLNGLRRIEPGHGASVGL